jgi:hypothetical protein
VRHDGLERGFRQLELKIDRAPVSLVDDRAVAVRADEKTRDRFDGPLRGGQTHAHERRLSDLLQALERQREMRARREPITAWISSTITVRTVRSICRLRSAIRSR